MNNVYNYKSRESFTELGRGGGVNQDHTFSVATWAVGKSKSAESPYLLANEWITSSIAQFLRLPMPPFAIVRRTRNDAMFITYDFEGDSQPDDADPSVLYNTFPLECTGVVVLDILTVNCDRTKENIKVDNPAAPKEFHVFDHERSLFYVHAKEGMHHLQSREQRLGVTEGADSTNEFHCLIELVDKYEHLEEWISRVESIPDWFIDEVCDEIQSLSMKKSECRFVKDFLKKRKCKVGDLIRSNKDRFPGVTNWGLF